MPGPARLRDECVGSMRPPTGGLCCQASWRHDASRNDVGIWISNCAGYNRLWRTSVISRLVESGLRVASYGECHKTVPPELRATALNQGMRLPSGDPGYCHSHRVMLAVENNACSDWVSDNLCQALQCGAIPIIKSVWSNGSLLPDYQALYGDAIEHLVINASRPGWLSELRRIMSDDTHYQRRHRAWVQHGAEALAAGRARADPGNWHCMRSRLETLHGRRADTEWYPPIM